MTNEELTALAADCEARAEAGEKPAHPGWTVHPESGNACLKIAEWASMLHGDVPWFEIGANRHPAAYSVQSHPAYWTVCLQTLLNYCKPTAHEFSSIFAAQMFAEAFLKDLTAPLHAARIAALEARIAELEEENTHILSDDHAEVMGGLVGMVGEHLAEKQVERLKARIAALESPRLRPMAEAPRDGTPILLFRTDEEKKAHDDAVVLGSTFSAHEQWGDNARYLGDDWCFAGWLPLPAPEETK